MADLARTLRPGGGLRVLVSIEDRDRAAIGASVGDPGLDTFAASLGAVGLEVVERRDVTAEDMTAIRSSWARRLGIPSRRSARLLVARMPASGGERQALSASAIVVATSRMRVS